MRTDVTRTRGASVSVVDPDVPATADAELFRVERRFGGVGGINVPISSTR